MDAFSILESKEMDTKDKIAEVRARLQVQGYKQGNTLRAVVQISWWNLDSTDFILFF